MKKPETPEQQFAQLKHVRRTLPNNGSVLVLDTGALITAEANAMIQALHSRSIGGIEAHLVKLAQKGAKAFMDNWYIGYGDKSIGDCGTATVFIEGVSMLVAKAVQDFQLYNGQESSTRYIDFSTQPFLNPHGSKKAAALLESLRSMHLEGLEVMREILTAQHPWDPAVEPDEKKWMKAIKARAFDIMRGFLPAGAVTNLAWHGELRQFSDHIQRLRNHPLEEVRTVAQTVHEALDEMFPSSFKQKIYPDSEAYTKKWLGDLYYFQPKKHPVPVTLEHNGVDQIVFKTYVPYLTKRPIKTEPPKFLAECGAMRFSFLLDFGSFRDLQRHRSLIQRMPLVTDRFGFEPWYLEQMETSLRKKAKAFLAEYKKKLNTLKLSPLVAQYYQPMGYRVPCRITGDIPALIWVVELRSGIAVHPTLRKVAQGIGAIMHRELGEKNLTLHIDLSEDQFNHKRGGHDIVEKK